MGIRSSGCNRLRTAAVVFLSPVEDGFGQRHGGAHKPEERRNRGAGHVRKVEVADVHKVLDNIESGYISEAMSLCHEAAA